MLKFEFAGFVINIDRGTLTLYIRVPVLGTMIFVCVCVCVGT